ncbi:hypothetical protein HOLleu_38681 [Holothuria leucospilota]|uniref:Apple domain-containing protein n=1 Tax=Holothuria leucospilota TaxID=206669 RepID=A0A9Q0YMA0_HOLLE|nr:hypothetical protein HOLleu_38681 [Holothuria leucospilota]
MTSRSTSTAVLATTYRPTTLRTTTIELTTDVKTTTVFTIHQTTTRSTIKPRTTEKTTIQKPTTHVTTTDAQTTQLAASSKPATTVITTEFTTTTIQATPETTTPEVTKIMTTSGSMLLEETTTGIQTTRSGLLGRKKELNCSHVVDVDALKSNYSSYLFQRTESFNNPKRVLENSRVLRPSIMCAVSCLKHVNCSAILFHNADGNGIAVCELLGESLEETNEASLHDGVISYLKLTCFQ